MSERANKLLRLALDQAATPEGATALRLLAEMCARDGLEVSVGERAPTPRRARGGDADAQIRALKASLEAAREVALVRERALGAVRRRMAELSAQVTQLCAESELAQARERALARQVELLTEAYPERAAAAAAATRQPRAAAERKERALKINLRHADVCAVCGEAMRAQERAWWRRGAGVWHPNCARATWQPGDPASVRHPKPAGGARASQADLFGGGR